MTAYVLEDYLRDLSRHLPELGFRDRDATLGEVRAHLTSEAARLRAEDPHLSADEAMLKATAAFGEPSEIGVEYGPGGGLVRRGTGDRILRVAVLTGRMAARTGRAAGRGARAVLKWSAITLAFLLVLGVTVALVLAITYHDTVDHAIRDAEATHVDYRDSGTYGIADPHTGSETPSFAVSTSAAHVDVDLSVQPQAGCLAIILKAPDGTVAYQNGSGCQPVSYHQSFTQAGTWTLQLTYVSFVGSYSGQATEYPAPSPA